LAIVQKNAPELGHAGRDAGLDFAIAEDCEVHDECDVYTEAYWKLYDEAYADGTAEATVDKLAETVPTSDSLTAEDLQTAIDSMSDWVQQRTAALENVRNS
jgi:spore coat protein CotH